jgi:hypothetical protein
MRQDKRIGCSEVLGIGLFSIFRVAVLLVSENENLGCPSRYVEEIDCEVAGYIRLIGLPRELG